MAGFTIADRKFGDGFTIWKAHDAGGTPYFGEIDLTEILAETGDLGGTAVEGATLAMETDLVMDEISQEMSAVNMFVGGGRGTFTVTMSMGGATKLALAAGLTAATSESDVLASGDDADTVIIGARQPTKLTLLHKVANIHQTSNAFSDYVYMPRAMVDPKIKLVFSRAGIRQAEVTFHLMASQQDGSTGTPTSTEMQMAFGGGGIAKIFIQTST